MVRTPQEPTKFVIDGKEQWLCYARSGRRGRSTRAGIYHDGCFATLRDVVDHYDRHFATRLSGQDKADWIEFLKSL